MKYALIYGLLSGLVIVGTITAGLALGPENSIFSTMWFGYLVMLVALSFVFMGVKRYRDVEKGGAIRFMPALGMGLGIAVVAALAYILVWEIYLAATGYRFMDEFLAAMARGLEAQGKSASEVAAEMAEFQWMRDNYGNPLIRIPVTFLEIFPVGLIVALFSAAVLRNPRVLPARVAG
ncbi:DUF4199 domain-containing protein [Sphingosinicella sp.]|uniref:DUF4199 domain-containing protein n=1 Tax=Sphingosinicella sp. TaxID=1917971 RepID=UPI004037C3B1